MGLDDAPSGCACESIEPKIPILPATVEAREATRKSRLRIAIFLNSLNLSWIG
jgi:hypothetical protein